MENSLKDKKVYQISSLYYSRKDVQEAIFSFCKNREVVPRYFEGFGKRPDSLGYPNDIMQHVKNNATSFHCSQELWDNPLDLATEMPREKLDELRNGWDLLIDIDSKYFDYSKISAELLVQALEFHGVKNIGIKFSGGKGVHIIIPQTAFPKIVRGIETKNMFPEWPRVITQYLNELIKPKLISKITELTTKESYVKDYDEAAKVMPDLILVSSRHLFRCPYSLHEKTGLASVVIDKAQLKDFNLKMAEPLKAEIKNFYPDCRESEARELLISSLDWYEEKEKDKKSQKDNSKRKFEEVNIDKAKIVYPPCIDTIMKGMADGKKRALFILLNYFNSLNLTWEEIEIKLNEWNEKNKPKLREGYIQSQLNWHKRQKKMLPPNCDKDYYKGIGVCNPDTLCAKIKNPVNYTIVKMRKK